MNNYFLIRSNLNDPMNEQVIEYLDSELREVFTEHELMELSDGFVVHKVGKHIDFHAVDMVAAARFAFEKQCAKTKIVMYISS